MIKLKPSNIFDFYAPTGNSSKIADHGFVRKEFHKPQITVPNHAIQEIPGKEKKDNTVLYILIGITVTIGLVLYLDYRDREIIKKIKQKESTI